MGLLPEFLTLLGIEIFAAISLVSVLLDRDLPPSTRWLFQGAAGLGLGQLVVTEAFGTSSVIDASRFWISVFYLTMSVCTVAGLNVYLAAVRRKMAIASVFSGTITTPIVTVAVLFVSSYLSGVDIIFSSLNILIIVLPAAFVGLSTYLFSQKRSKLIGRLKIPGLTSASAAASIEAPKVFEPLDLKAILGEWEESLKKKEDVA